VKLTDEIWKVLEPAAKIGDKASREDIEKGLQKGEFQLFQKNNSAAVTATIKNSLRIGLAGGDLKDLIDIEKNIEKYARDRYFNCIDILGREGWEKTLPGYKKKAVLLRKEIK
tara:strand:+ start:934 stop:1272 length:339 start_codon:yes stop_codon:yes gene_type:complete